MPTFEVKRSTKQSRSAIETVLRELRRSPLLALIFFVPVVILLERMAPKAHTLLFFMAIAAIVPLAALLSRATESVAAKTGDAVGGLLNATLGNLTELIITLAALQAGQYLLVKASIAGAIVTNSLFMFGGAFLIGGLKHHLQEFNRVNARFQASLLFLATIAILVPSLTSGLDRTPAAEFSQQLSLGLAILLIAVYGLGMVFSLKTHKELFASVGQAETGEKPWPLSIGIVVLIVVTLLVAMVSEIFVGSVQAAAQHLGLTPAFVGFIVIALVGGAAEMTTAFSAARANRLDLSVGIALGSAAQIALFVAPVLVLVSYFIGPQPMSLEFWPGAVAMMLVATMAATLLSNGGHAAWYAGVMALAVYAIFALTLFLLPPGVTQ
ncbi:calcium/proton exchanger [Sinorhizobium meliloti]|uniref:calcium/proton exchanger n=1 Tax=Rhizobium meliloti TaxID=382 RepID=UPI000FD80907|nr:calcium/proton exchanger [Sinorhizobium meliloti]RVK72047.1 calcium/proton exchanger [Sinorhizobium meliloti]RVQ70417.1 calcium/proton exchanger [Sinorhizobium meliloti]WGI77240.1 calcium/proton exchanger [Sinorhizobium meliloti]